ncbi:phage holin family protein [Saliterribacillus persicus]|uniref:Holin family Hol44 protein (Superfamily V) n=1 Tax=Saliterribacillus persicus TaxID=930114 RepID=A0A368XZL5_9BACI|nr:phage holin family protein [Saliterribacillus persicus]RCW71997.1 holin family Hol44 protein (superfamily V) [Saliterribacillus persicus]
MIDLYPFLNEDYLFIVPVLWIFGMALKRTPFIQDWMIIWILLGISIGLSGLYFGFTINAIIDGVIIAGIAVFSHQLMKQTINRN